MFYHAPQPAFRFLNGAIRRHLVELLNDTRAGNAWGVGFELKKLNKLYSELELKRALHAAKAPRYVR